MQQCIKILVIYPKIANCQNLLLTNTFYNINHYYVCCCMYVELRSEFRKRNHQIRSSYTLYHCCGDIGKENTQYFISYEAILIESMRYVEAVAKLIVTFYVYDISYPKGLMPLYIFLQHYVMGMKDEQAVTNTMIMLVSNLKKIPS